MPTVNSYLIYTGNGSQTKFVLTGIDGWLNSGFLEVYVNGTLQTTGYSLITESGVDKIQFTTAPSNASIVTIKRNTPNTLTGFKNDVVDFNDGSVLTAAALDRAVEALVHISQEIEDQTGATLGLTIDQTAWDAESKRLSNLADGLNTNDAVTMGQFTIATLFGGAVVVPQIWNITGTNSIGPYTLSGTAPLNTDPKMFIVENGGVIMNPSEYAIDGTLSTITFTTAKTGAISIRNFGVARNIAASTSIITDNSVTTSKIVNNAVTFDKMQALNADTVIGAVTAGNPTEIPCTSIARNAMAQTTNSAFRSAIGCGAVATLDTILNAYYANNSISASKLMANSVTTSAIASGAITSNKIEVSGPHWDAEKTIINGLSPMADGGTAPYIYLRNYGNITVQTGGLGGSELVWQGKNPAGANSTTIRADGVPTATTDLTTKAYVDAKPFYDWNPYIVTPTYTGSYYVNTDGVVTEPGGGAVRIRLNGHLLPYRRLCLVDGIVGPLDGSGNGPHWFSLYNGGASTMTFRIFRAYFEWISNRVPTLVLPVSSPAGWETESEALPGYNATAGIGPFAFNSKIESTAVFTVTAGQDYKFYQPNPTNPSDWTGTYGTGQVVVPVGAYVDQPSADASTVTNGVRNGCYARMIISLMRLT